MKQKLSTYLTMIPGGAKSVYRRILSINKYAIITLSFLAIFIFFDEYSLVKRYQNIARITQLENELSYHEKQLEGTRKQLEELDSDNENLEKYAREQYMMKRKDEDIFVIK